MLFPQSSQYITDSSGLLKSDGGKQMILREHYLAQIRPFYDSDLIKIITGIRRCEKSVIMQQVRDEIQKNMFFDLPHTLCAGMRCKAVSSVKGSGHSNGSNRIGNNGQGICRIYLRFSGLMLSGDNLFLLPIGNLARFRAEVRTDQSNFLR